MHQAILPGTYTPLTEVRTPHLHCSTSTVLPQLLPPSLLREPLHFLVSGSDLLAFGPCDLESFSPLQQSSLFLQHLISELLEVLHCPPLSLLLLCNPLPLGLFFGFGLYFSPGFLSCMLCMTGCCCLLQLKEGLLLLLMPLLHLIALLLEHFSIVLGKVKVGEGRHDNTETRVKKLSFLFMYC